MWTILNPSSRVATNPSDIMKAKFILLPLLICSFVVVGCASQPPSEAASNLKLETITNDGRTNYVFRATAK